MAPSVTTVRHFRATRYSLGPPLAGPTPVPYRLIQSAEDLPGFAAAPMPDVAPGRLLVAYQLTHGAICTESMTCSRVATSASGVTG